MTALTPHIRAIRAEAKHLFAWADKATDPTLAKVMRALASAKEGAADQLEAEDQALAARVHGI